MFLTLPATRIQLTNEVSKQWFCSLISAKEPSFSNVSGFFDGSKLPLHNQWNTDIQNGSYSGWKWKCFASQVLVSGPDGCFIYPNQSQWPHCPAVKPGAHPELRAVGAPLLPTMKYDVLQEVSEEEYREAVFLSAKICSPRLSTNWGNRNLQSMFEKIVSQ